MPDGIGEFLTRKIGPLSAWGWFVAAAGGGFVFLRWRQRKASSAGGAGASTTYVPYNPVTSSGGGAGGSTGGGGGGGPWNVPSDNLGSVIAGQIPGNLPEDTTNIALSPSPLPAALSPTTPVNPYSIGQVVSPGESIVSSVFSPLYGWLNETSAGGIYTSGGSRSIAQLPYSGSYLGYVAQQYGVGSPSAQSEITQHGAFAPGSLQVLPSGGYAQTNTRGETYTFQ